MGADKGGGEARRGVGAGAGELPVLDDPVALVAGAVAVVPPREQALLVHAPLHASLRPLPQRLLLRPLSLLRSRRRSPRRPHP